MLSGGVYVLVLLVQEITLPAIATSFAQISNAENARQGTE